MRSMLSLALGAVVLLTIGAGQVIAAAPSHDKVSFTGTDSDFCGTGNTVTFTTTGILNGWGDKAFGHIATTWINPLNGASVVDSFSGGGKVSFVDDGDGAYTIAITRVGMPEQLRLAGGGLLAQDVGVVTFYDHFDADDNYLGTDVVVVAGPHPFIDASSDLFCDLMIEALDL